MKLLRVLVRLRGVVPEFRIPPARVLHIFHGFTKGVLASKTMAAIHRGDTLEAYHGMLFSEVAGRLLEKLFIDFVGKFPGKFWQYLCLSARRFY